MNWEEWDKTLRNMTPTELKTLIEYANVIIEEKEIEANNAIKKFKEAFNNLKDSGIYVYPDCYEGEYIDSEDDFEFYTKDWRKIK